MYTLFTPKRIRRLILTVIFPICASLALSGLPRTHAQLPERIKAPELDGAGAVGSDKPIKLKDLRGKIVVLEFWTLC
jgi:hypothetical protein